MSNDKSAMGIDSGRFAPNLGGLWVTPKLTVTGIFAQKPADEWECRANRPPVPLWRSVPVGCFELFHGMRWVGAIYL